MLDVKSPFDGSLIKQIPLADVHDVEKALTVADKLFRNQAEWIPPHQRIEILERTAELIKSRVEELTNLAASEGGKPYNDSKVEVLRAINGVKLAAEYIGQIKGEQIPMGLTPASENRIAFTTREPIGVVVSISAFNHPLNLAVHQVATAIAAGCPVIIKPASTTPLSALNFGELLAEAGLPSGWCQVIVCKTGLAQKLVTDNRVSYLSFIGSADVGWKLKSKLSPGTHCALEHGGSAPVIVEKDAAFDQMLPALIKGGFYHAGQVCVSVQRVFVHQEIVSNFSEQFTALAKQLVVGNQMEKSTEVGPLISEYELERVEQWVREAVEEGAELLCGGKRLSNTTYAPTVLLNPSSESKVSKLEVFGPVVCIYSFSDRNEAISKANSLDLHFQASVFTQQLDIALETVKKLNAATVMVNDHTAFRVDWMPFGGRDASGIGVGGIPYSINEMTRDKLMVIKSDAL
ncbi:MAG: aldehyde dehydrogenase family protein [Bacteroidota bacterium]|nr:aldehyde dehydrogenase family protein [Bacteroidota bacterium]